MPELSPRRVDAAWRCSRLGRGCRGLAVAMWVAMLGACVFVPQTREVYDAGCQITYRQMTLEPVQVASLSHCHNQECGAALVFIGATAAASAVVSGSIVVVGNVVYWFEKQGRCIRGP